MGFPSDPPARRVRVLRREGVAWEECQAHVWDLGSWWTQSYSHDSESRLFVWHKFSRQLVYAWHAEARVRDPLSNALFEEYVMSFLSKPNPKKGDEVFGPAAVIDDFWSRYPAVWEWCTSTCWPGKAKEPRQTSTLTLFAEDGQWKVCLGDRDHDRSLWGTGATVEAALEVLDHQLRQERPNWRSRRKEKGARRKD